MNRVMPLFLSLVLLVSVIGCSSANPTPPTGTGTSTSTGTGTDQATIDKISMAIRLGTSTAIEIGFVAIPNATEAHADATLAQSTLANEVFPILNGDNAGFLNGLNQLMTLNAFNTNPALQKVKLVLQVAMPLLQAYLPANLTGMAVNQIPPEVKAYVTAFFNGVNDGLTVYNAKDMTNPAGRGFKSFDDLRTQLEAPLPK